MLKIKVGDLVEDCSLLPGVVMKISGDDIEIRRLDFDEYQESSFSHCSLRNCGIVKITSQEALMRLQLGKEKLTSIWSSCESYEEYKEKLDQEYSTKINKS